MFGIKNSGAYDIKGITEDDKPFIIEELRNQCQKMYPELSPAFDEDVIDGKKILRAYITHTDEPCYFKMSTPQDTLYYRYQDQNCRVFPFSQRVNRLAELYWTNYNNLITTNLEKNALQDFHAFYTNYCEKNNCWDCDAISTLCQSGILFPCEEQEYQLTLTDEGKLLFGMQAQARLIEVKEPLPNEVDNLFQEIQDVPSTKGKISKYDVNKLFSPAKDLWQQSFFQDEVQKILSEYDDYFQKDNPTIYGPLSCTIAEIENKLFSLTCCDKLDRDAIHEALCNAFLHQDLKRKCPVDVIYSSECNWILIRNAGGLVTPCSEKVLGLFPVGIRNPILKNAYSLITGTESFNQGIFKMQQAMAKRTYHAPVFVDARECFFTILLFTPNHNIEIRKSASHQQKSCDEFLEYILEQERNKPYLPSYPYFSPKPLDDETVEKNIKEMQSNLSDFLWKANSCLKIGNQARLCQELQDFCKEHNVPNPLLSK